MAKIVYTSIVVVYAWFIALSIGDESLRILFVIVYKMIIKEEIVACPHPTEWIKHWDNKKRNKMRII